MNAAEHYRAAEDSRGEAWDLDRMQEQRANLLADAQVHAMLALVGAVMLASNEPEHLSTYDDLLAAVMEEPT